MNPQRIQRKRTRGWRMPKGAVYVGRPTKWGNPFRPTDSRIANGAFNPETVALLAFKKWAARQAGKDPSWLEPLRGKDLACWCGPDTACHADVLLRLANE